MLFFSFGARDIRSVFPIEENFQADKEQKLCSDYRDYLCEGCVPRQQMRTPCVPRQQI
jgi:hypothetical protein